MRKLLARDLKYIVNKSKKLMLIYLFLIVLSQFFILPHGDYNSMELFIGLLFDGGYIESFSNFEPPITWLLFQLIPVFVVSFVTYQDHIDNASYILVKTRSRKMYFLSKISSGIISIGIINVFVYLLVITDTFLVSSFDKAYFIIFTRLIFSYIVTQSILFAIAFILAIVFGFKAGVASTLIFLVLSMTSNFKGFIGQQTLAFKTDVMGGYISMVDNLIVWLVYIILIIIGSVLVFRSYNFYGGSND
ncbi:hypothetical protein [Anaerococcus tetradius]|jgi:hypothetical protein|uniref:hypothetical protein n=1 Tax=Anaerococcus tetradius TaxID=33036 RepID=UPI0023F31EE4|nr:hypothetical protein [Anaerococcus tetradius]